MEAYKKYFYIGNNIVFSSSNAIETNLLPDVDPSLLKVPSMKTVSSDYNRHIGYCIILYLPALLKPKQLCNYSVITLGRHDKYLNIQPTVDLSDHNALALGVSRIHAEITYEAPNYYVRDLNSKNGTWVNKTKLIADEKIQLINQDSLRLAHFMIHVISHQN